MSDPDQPISPPRPSGQPRPQRAGQRVRKPTVPKGMSVESRFVGYLVLGFGVLAMLAVLIIAFGGHDSVDTATTPDEQEQALSASLKTDLSQNSNNTAQKSEAGELALDRQPKLNPSRIEGAWQASVSSYVAVMQIEKGAYQVILAEPGSTGARLYSSGVYRVVDDMLLFSPRLDWGAPHTAAGNAVRYERMTAGRSSVLVGFKDGAMIWQNVPGTERRERPHNRSPIILRNDKPYVVWKKVK